MRGLAVLLAVVMLGDAAEADEPSIAPSGEREAQPLRLAGAVSMGIGAALAIATGGLVLYSHGASNDIERLSRTNVHDWSPDDQALWDKAKRADRIARITAIASGATLVTGAVLYYLGWRSEAAQVTVEPIPGGASMGFACVF